MRYTSKEDKGILDYCLPKWKSVLFGMTLVGLVIGYHQNSEQSVEVYKPINREVIMVSDDEKQDCDNEGHCRARLF